MAPFNNLSYKFQGPGDYRLIPNIIPSSSARWKVATASTSMNAVKNSGKERSPAMVPTPARLKSTALRAWTA